MEVVILKMLFVVSVSAQFGKHVYVDEKMGWHDAQQYCRTYHTDLSALTTRWEEEALKNATAGKVYDYFWLGLYRTGPGWNWSGGARATYIPWDEAQFNDKGNAGACVCWQRCTTKIEWTDVFLLTPFPFFCINFIVMEEKMSWEQALTHCTQTHTTLISLTSEAEQLLALSEIQQEWITERVWIGLRYFSDEWLWMDGSPLEYQAWAPEEDQCPLWKRCGALTKEGKWESADCSERLNFICY